MPDVIAGVTLAALAVPEVIGYTQISGTPVVTGLYTMLIPAALYALLGSSRHLVVGADSATAAILASTLIHLAVPRSVEWTALAGILALMAAAFLLVARIARLGFLADFLSRTVLIGFLSGVGLQVAFNQIPGMLALPESTHLTVLNLMGLLRTSNVTRSPDLYISAAVLLIIVVSRMISPKIPGALIAILLSVLVSWWFGFREMGIHLTGMIPGGLPSLVIPQGLWNWQLIEQLVPTAFAMFVVILSQSAATARAYAIRYNESFDPNVDLIGLCLANVGAGLTGTFVVNGSPTKTQMVESAGGQSQLAQLTTTVVVLLILIFFTSPLSYLPTASLSTLVFLIGIELIDWKGMRRILHERQWEFWVALATSMAVMLVGVEKGILLAVVLSLVVHTRHGYLVNNMLLVLDSANGWRQKKADASEQILPGLIIYRFMHNIYYANCQLLMQEAKQLVESSEPPLNWFCIDAAAINDVDYTAAETLRSLHEYLRTKGVRLVFCELVDEVRVQFERSGLVTMVGQDAFFLSPNTVIKEYSKQVA